MLFSVGIPTLQRAAEFGSLLDLYLASESVGEVIVVNNSGQPVSHQHPKLRVLQQAENIYVNPAWNLIARNAEFPHLVFSNDNISFDPSLLPRVGSFLARHRVGIVGPHRSCFTLSSSLTPRFRPHYRRSFGFGTLMFLPRRNYARIPDHLKIWYGDDWLFSSQKYRNWSFRGERIATSMSTTSASTEFASRWGAETTAFRANERPDAYDRRFGWERRTHRAMSMIRDVFTPTE